MILIVGLGNPGRKFQRTRHNLGFWVLDRFKKKNKFSDWKLKKKFEAKISEGKLGRKKIILAKPQTFMNNSGRAVKLLIAYYRLPLTNLFVVHDDLDILLGKIKIVKTKGSAGHRGVQSIIDEIKKRNFIRFRIGIRPKISNSEFETKDKFVLQKFSKEEIKILKKVIERTGKAIETTINKGVEKTMSQFNKS